LSAQFITPEILIGYRIGEIINNNQDVISIVLFPSENVLLPSIYVKIRYIKSVNGIVAGFSAAPVIKKFILTNSAYEKLEAELSSIMEGINNAK